MPFLNPARPTLSRRNQMKPLSPSLSLSPGCKNKSPTRLNQACASFNWLQPWTSHRCISGQMRKESNCRLMSCYSPMRCMPTKSDPIPPLPLSLTPLRPSGSPRFPLSSVEVCTPRLPPPWQRHPTTILPSPTTPVSSPLSRPYAPRHAANVNEVTKTMPQSTLIVLIPSIYGESSNLPPMPHGLLMMKWRTT